MKIFTSAVLCTQFITVLLTGCAQNQNANPAAIPAESAAPLESDLAASAGLQKPMGFGIIPITAGEGFSVYGSASVKTNTREVRAEIDTKDLDKIRVGYKISISNIDKGVFSKGTIVGLPEKQSLTDEDICHIDILLDDATEAAAEAEIPIEQPTQSTEQNSQDSGEEIIMESVSISSKDGLPGVDAQVEVQIHLPADDSAIYIDNNCIFEGNNGKKYVWASDKSITEVQVDDLTLVEVIPGETDGKVTQIISGLKDSGSILVAAN